MKIIVLQGMPSNGKTTTINIVWDLLIKNGGKSLNKHSYGGDQNDFIDTVLWKSQKIGLLSMGDTSTLIAKEIRNFDSQNCDVVVCALSINNEKVRANNAINMYNNTRINKTVAQDKINESAANIADAQTIYNLI